MHKNVQAALFMISNIPRKFIKLIISIVTLLLEINIYWSSITLIA